MNDLLLENTNGKVTEVYPIKKKIDVTYYYTSYCKHIT